MVGDDNGQFPRPELETEKGETGPALGENGEVDVSARPKIQFSRASRHPLVVTLVGFLCTGILGAYLSWWLNDRSHEYDIASSIRTNAIASVSDISELLNERRERGVLVISSIRRGAPQAEVSERKAAYDEAYVHWNTKMPGNLLRVRVALKGPSSRYEWYMDGLTNLNMLLHGSDRRSLLHGRSFPPNPGLVSVLDACITQAFDAYRADSFELPSKASEVISRCNYSENNARLIDCFAMVSEALYLSVSEPSADDLKVEDSDVIRACTPAPTISQPVSPPEKANLLPSSVRRAMISVRH